MWHKGILAVAAAAALFATPPAAADAAQPTHVAIVIVGHGAHCVSWHSGITGDEVLNDVATVRYRPSDGLITQIDGTPQSNRADDTHYWSYWHNTGSGWTYSTAGASSYHPKAGTVEGWHFINGSPTATPPPNRTYASICTDDRPSEPRTSEATSAQPTSTRTSEAKSATPTLRTSEATSAPKRTSAAKSASPRTSEAKPAASEARTSAAGTSEATSAPPTPTSAAGAPRPDTGSALPTVLVVSLVLVLGGAATVVARRRRA